MYDAIGKTINTYIDELGSVPKEERAEKVLCVILTDGEENDSKSFNKDHIKDMIEEMKKDFNWQFIFLAANQDAMLTATGMGISTGNSLNFAYSGDGIKSAYATVSRVTSKYRSSSKSTVTDSLVEEDSEENK